MFSKLTQTLTQKFSASFLIWTVTGWVFVLLFPLLKLIPEPSTQTGHPWKVDFVFSIFILPLLVFALFKKNQLLPKKRAFFDEKLLIFLIPFFIFILWSGFSMFWALHFQSVAHHTLVWGSYFVFFIACLFAIISSKTIEILIVPTLLVALILFASCAFDFIGLTDFEAVEGILRIRYGKFAEMILPVAPLFMALALYSKGLKNSYIYLIAAIGSWLTVMFSLSRGAFLSGFVGFGIFFIATIMFSHRRFRRRTLLFAGIWLAITLIVQITFSFSSGIPSTADYLSNKRDGTEQNTAFRIYTWKLSGQMIKDNLLLGVGADNFGLMINSSRREYVLKYPDDDQNQIGEWYMFERSHNELIQIFAELGIIGIIIFATFIIGFGYLTVMSLIRNSYKFPPILLGCISGLIAFFISSMFSSFSFRSIQNGLMFFLVLAIASNELLKIRKKQTNCDQSLRLPFNRVFRPFLIFSIIILGLLMFTAGKKGISQYYVYLAENSPDFPVADKNYQNAIFYEKENASAYFSYGLMLLKNKESDKASDNLRAAIEKGVGVTPTYSYLATSHVMSNDSKSAEQTMAEAVGIFPRSVFARVRYALLLNQNGNVAESENQLKMARDLDELQAEGWHHFIKYGTDETAIRAREKKDIPELSDLKPSAAVYAIVDNEAYLQLFPDRR